MKKAKFADIIIRATETFQNLNEKELKLLHLFSPAY